MKSIPSVLYPTKEIVKKYGNEKAKNMLDPNRKYNVQQSMYTPAIPVYELVTYHITIQCCRHEEDLTP